MDTIIQVHDYSILFQEQTYHLKSFAFTFLSIHHMIQNQSYPQTMHVLMYTCFFLLPFLHLCFQYFYENAGGYLDKQRAHIFARVLLPGLYFIHQIPFVPIEGTHLKSGLQGSLLFMSMSIVVFPIQSDIINFALHMWVMVLRMLLTYRLYATVRYATIMTFSMDVCLPFLLMKAQHYVVQGSLVTSKKEKSMIVHTTNTITNTDPRVGEQELTKYKNTTYRDRDIDIKDFLMLCFLASQHIQSTPITHPSHGHVDGYGYGHGTDNALPFHEHTSDDIYEKRRVRRMACSDDDAWFQTTHHHSLRTQLVA